MPISSDDGRVLPTAERFKGKVCNCPLRYVLSDELVRCATQLAYAEGDRLSACLDLVHIPSQSVWVEWADAPRREALKEIPALEVQCRSNAQRGGVLVSAAPDCRSGHIRTFWSMPDDRAYLSPVVTDFNLDRQPEAHRSRNFGGWRGDAFLKMEEEPAIDELLAHLRFHFDDEWAGYYGDRCHTEKIRAAVLRSNLGCVAFDGPMLMAFFLLLSARNLLPHQTVRHEKLNRVRQRAGKPALLEHVEICAPLDTPNPSRSVSDSESSRLSPRLHHVRGHIVRRGATVFWRSPHLRGSARLGRVRTRTVALSFARPNTVLPNQLGENALCAS